MADYDYKVVPFIGKIRSGGSAQEVSTQLQAAIAQHKAGGWELHQIAEVNIEVTPGCLAGLLGGKVSYVKFDQIIFRKPT